MILRVKNFKKMNLTPTTIRHGRVLLGKGVLRGKKWGN